MGFLTSEEQQHTEGQIFMGLLTNSFPPIIQGGMGIGVSNWQLARAVSQTGQLGVVSGTGLAAVLTRRLQAGDLEGNMREAMRAFPIPEIADRVLKRYFVAGGKEKETAYRSIPLPNLSQRESAELSMVGNFVEVYLAKRGFQGVIGVNLLEKIQIPNLASLFGAMLAGVDYVLMGAGIPRAIPRVLDQFSKGIAAELKIDVHGAGRNDLFTERFDPSDFGFPAVLKLKRPLFLAIVSSITLAKSLTRRTEGQVDGFVVEGHTAGGHNAPPRGCLKLSESGEPIFGERDQPDIGKIRELGLPFWLAGGYGRPGQLIEAQSLGAVGIQVGTAFAFCEESGLSPVVKAEGIRQSRAGETRVFTDPLASPTGFPFKVARIAGTLSERQVYSVRHRICDLGYLRTPYRREDGSLGYRCPGEPEGDFLRKGGTLEATIGRKCLCNGLFAAIGLPQVRNGIEEPMIVTVGEDISQITDFIPEGQVSYNAADVVTQLLRLNKA